jgi:hypothetical protein
MKNYLKLIVELLVVLSFMALLLNSIIYGGELTSFRGDPASYEDSPVKYLFNFVIHLLVILAFGISGYFTIKNIKQNSVKKGKC